MSDVLLALCPGMIVMTFVLGPSVLLQAIIAIVGAVFAETLALILRGRPVTTSLKDLTAVLTGILLALSIPPLAPWWIAFLGAIFGILIGKQVYGGMGQNPFNPAMAGYAFLMISFPRWMTLWPESGGAISDGSLGMSGFSFVLFGMEKPLIDAIAAATPLAAFHDVWQSHAPAQSISLPATAGWTTINLAYLAGGLWLMRRRVIDYRIVVGLLATLAGGILIIQSTDSKEAVGLWSSLLLGSTMLGTFFIATDPVSAPNTPRGRWIFGAGIGLIVLLIRRYGGYPDGFAFAVLAMNLVAPTLDRLTRPLSLGEQQPER